MKRRYDADYTGRVFGEWTVVSKEHPSRSGAIYRCRCSCGVEKNIVASTLRRGKSNSCGCKRLGPRVNLVGSQFGKWLVVSQVGNDWLCRCECGTEATFNSGNLSFYRDKYPNRNCGCGRRNQYRLGADGNVTTEYKIWCSAKGRAKKENLPFSIQVSDIEVPPVCPLLGIPLQVGVGVFTEASPSLDRKVPTLGYVKGNVWVVSFRANNLKRDASTRELEQLVKGLKHHGVK